jgi:mutator protein MutT
MTRTVLHVVAGVLNDADGRVLIAQRPPGKHLAGGWEFPGGKRDDDERREAALAREFKEELDVDVTASIGLVYCGADYLWAEDIIKDADIALHFAKHTKEKNIMIFNPVKHGEYRKPEKYASILRVGLSPGDPTKPRT